MTKENRKALILVNVGTPEKAEKKAVRKFLSLFLNDKKVIDLPFLVRKLLVNLIIIPLRLKKSTNLYKQLFKDGDSPISTHLYNLCEETKKCAGSETEVFPAMRYGNPDLKKLLEELSAKNYSELIIFPLFPQYASSTTGTIFAKVFSTLKNKEVIPPIRFIDQYYKHPAFIKTYSEHIKTYQPERFDHIVFSFHGLPLRHINKVHPHKKESQCTCSKKMPASGHHCYKAVSYEMARLLAKALGLTEKDYSIGFQSRLSKNWLSPFTDELLLSLAQQGYKKILICAPSFVADCLETIVEIEDEYKNHFLSAGGEELAVVSPLNSSPQWAESLCKIASV